MDEFSNPLLYLFGAAGTDNTNYSAVDGNSASIKRGGFRHHTFQRVKKTGESGDPTYTIQASLVTSPETEDWVNVGVLNDATPVLHFHHVCWPYVRCVRSGGTTTKSKVLVLSSNTLVDAM